MVLEKQKLISLVIGILGIAAVAAPILASSDVAFWMWGLIVTISGEVAFVFEQTEQVVFSAILLSSAIIVVVGLLLHFMAYFSKVDLKTMPAWLPGLLITIGMGFPTFYFLMNTIAGGGGVIPIGIIPGLIGGIWAWVIGARADLAKH